MVTNNFVDIDFSGLTYNILVITMNLLDIIAQPIIDAIEHIKSILFWLEKLLYLSPDILGVFWEAIHILLTVFHSLSAALYIGNLVPNIGVYA